MSGARKKLKPDEINLGEPIPWSIYSKDGNVYFRQGFVFHTEKSLERLSGIDLYHDAALVNTREAVESGLSSSVEAAVPFAEEMATDIFSANEAERSGSAGNAENDAQQAADSAVLALSPEDEIIKRRGIFSLIDESADAVEKALFELRNGNREGVAEIRRIARLIRQLVERDADICIAAIHMDRRRDLRQLKPVFTALLCALQAEQFALEDNPPYYSFLCAALTVDVNDPQVFFRCWGDEPEKVKQFRKNRMQGAMLLGGLGVKDREWLDILFQSCGSDKGLSRPAVILRVSEAYLHYLLFGEFGAGTLSRDALQKVFSFSHQSFAGVNISFIKMLGVYPPGSIVRLKNGETGVVVRRDKNNTLNAEIISLYRSNNEEYKIPIYRMTSDPGYAVQELLRPGEIIIEKPEMLWQLKRRRR